MRVLFTRRFASGLLCWLIVGCGSAPAVGPGDALDPVAGDASPGDVSAADVLDAPEREVQRSSLPEELSGGFVDLTAAVSPWPPFYVHPGEVATERMPDVTFGVFADLNGGKSFEVILSGAFGDQTSRQTYAYDQETEALLPWGEDALPPGLVSGVLDLDGDGHVDALMAEADGRIRVRWGDAIGSYATFTELATAEPTLFSERTSFHLTDLDQDGWLDVMMNAPCGMALLFRTGPRTWEHRPEALQGFDSQNPYALSTWSSQGRAPVIFALGHPTCGFYSAFQVSARDAQGYPLFEPVSVYDPGQSHERLDDVSPLISPMGAASADLNRDGAMDLVVTLDPAHIILDGSATWPIKSTMPESGLLFSTTESGGYQVGWGIALVDLDKDGLEDVIVAHGDDAARFLGEQASPGPQHATVHLNLGDFRFLDATAHLGLDRLGGWRALTTGDLDGDADCDLIIGGLGEPPRIYRNDVTTPNRNVALRLRGRASNRLGIGAEVVVNPIGTSGQHRYVVGASGGPKALSEPMIFAGLGTAVGADVTVYWPSGAVQTISGLIAGQAHLITEPELLAISPASRHLVAGGTEVATLTIRPHTSATSVTVAITHGDGIPSQAVEEAPGVWTVTLTPPPSVGSARLEIRIDGAVLPAAPRLWWDGQ